MVVVPPWIFDYLSHSGEHQGTDVGHYALAEVHEVPDLKELEAYSDLMASAVAVAVLEM